MEFRYQNLVALESISIFHAVFVFLIAYLIHWYLKPKNIIKDYSNVGYDHLLYEERVKKTRKSAERIARECEQKRIKGNVPPPFPNGWFALLDSSDVAVKKIKHVSALGESFVVFRDETGLVHILSAICPHLGANLAIGGKVEGDCIRCPFHGWKFSGTSGICVEIPYSEKIPDGAKVKQWHSCEVNSFIFLWHHAENADPTWHPEAISNINNRKWWYRGRTEHYVNTHIQDILENGADMTHLPILHSSSVLKWCENISIHNWHADWTYNVTPKERHIASMTLQTDTVLFNRFKIFRMNVNTDQIGPGYVVMNLETNVGPIIILMTVVPVGPLQQKVVQKMFYPLRTSVLGSFMFYAERVMFERDVVIWNHKKYHDKPLLTKEETLIVKYRRWFSQFYSENSIKYGKKCLDW